jgi:hypothetical protein
VSLGLQDLALFSLTVLVLNATPAISQAKLPSSLACLARVVEVMA